MKSMIILSSMAIIFLVNLASADIISINSGGGDKVVLTSNEFIEGFFFGTVSSVTTATGGGGGGGVIFGADIGLCNETYNYTRNHGMNLSFVNEFIIDLKNRTNKTYSKPKVVHFIENWQPLCSDLINRTLKEKFVCGEIRRSISIGKNNLTKMELLSKKLDSIIKVSPELLSYYSENVETLCPRKPFAIFPWDTPIKKTALFFLIISLFVLILIVSVNNRKKLKIPIVDDLREYFKKSN